MDDWLTISAALATVAAVGIAAYQLHLQRKETRRNGQLSALIHVADVLKARIDRHEKIIADMKARKEDWSGHANRVNSEFMPMLTKVQTELLDLLAGYEGTLDAPELRRVLGLKS